MVAGRPMLGGLKLLLDRFRLFTDADDTAPAGASESRAATPRPWSRRHWPSRCSARCTSFCAAWTAPSRRSSANSRRVSPDHLYEGLLTVLMRLVFMLYAEDRDLLPSRSDGRAREIYETSYSRARAVRQARSKTPRSIRTRWTSAAVAGAGCWRCSGLIHKGHSTGFVAGARRQAVRSGRIPVP